MCLQVKYAVAGSNESSGLLVAVQFEKRNIVEHWVFCVPQTTVADTRSLALSNFIIMYSNGIGDQIIGFK